MPNMAEQFGQQRVAEYCTAVLGPANRRCIRQNVARLPGSKVYVSADISPKCTRTETLRFSRAQKAIYSIDLSTTNVIYDILLS